MTKKIEKNEKVLQLTMDEKIKQARNFIPENGDMMKMLVVRSLVEKFSPTKKELDSGRVKQEIINGNVSYRYVPASKADKLSLSEAEVMILKEGFNKMNKENKITLEILDLAKKISEL